MTKLYLRTFGCQMNEYDSEKIADVLRAAHGTERTEQPEDADVIVFNTCSVRRRRCTGCPNSSSAGARAASRRSISAFR